MIKKLAHVCLLAADLTQCEDFYCGTLGLTRKFDFVKDGKIIGFYLEVAADQFVEVFQTDAAARAAGNRIVHFCLEVEDIHELAAALRRRGVPCTDPQLGADQSWQAWCKDPDGVEIEFHQYTGESCQRTGAVCPVNW